MSSNNLLTPTTEENCLTEIHVAPDGRVYLFGASAAVLEMIWAADFADDSLKVRLDRLRSAASRIVDSADESSFSACNQENLVNAPFTIPTTQRGTVRPRERLFRKVSSDHDR